MPIHTPKSKLVTQLKALINDAKNMPLKELCKTGNYSADPKLRYPQTKSEHIVAEALDLLLTHDWVDDDPLLDEIMSIFSQLDTGVNKQQDWQKLFELAKELV